MPKRIILVALAALATLAACNSANVNNLYGVSTPTPAPVTSPSPNPAVTAAIVTVYASSSPQPGIPVQLYNSSASARPIGTPIATQTTDPTGATTFTGLTGAAWYCFSVTYTAPAPGALAQQQEPCTNLWGYGVTISF